MIKNGKDTLLDRITGTLPQMNDALTNYFQPMTFVGLTKVIENFQVTEVLTPIDFLGVWQPMGTRKLAMKPEGQRSWRFYEVHAEVALVLNIDDGVSYLGKNYRVTGTQDYRLYGYVYYELTEDYTS